MQRQEMFPLWEAHQEPFAFPFYLPRESATLNLILPETIWTKTIQETRPGTKPRAFVHLALSVPSTPALKNPGGLGLPLAPQPREQARPACRLHTPDTAGPRTTPGPWAPSAGSPSCITCRSSVAEREPIDPGGEPFSAV